MAENLLRKFTSRATGKDRQWSGPVGMAVSVLLLGLVFVSLAATSWLRWADPIMDFGRELYYPWQILHGKMLQRDLYQIYGPFSDYFNALIMAVAGETVNSLFGINLILAASATGMILYLFGSWLGWLPGVLATLAFMVTGVFPRVHDHAGSFNFIAPYSHAATHGFISALVALTALMHFIRRPNPVGLYLAATFVGINFLTKPEFFIALLPAVGLFAFHVRQHYPQHWNLCRRHGVGLLLTALLPLLVFLGYFFTVLPPGQALRAVGGSWVAIFSGYLSQTQFQSVMSGLDHPLENLLSNMLVAFAELGLFAVAYWVFGRQNRPAWVAWLTLMACWMPLLVALMQDDQEYVSMFLMPRGFMVLACLILILTSGMATYGQQGFNMQMADVEPYIFLSIWSVFSCLLLIRILLTASFLSYGFVLLTPAFLGIIGLLTGVVPKWLVLRGKTVGARRFLAIHAAFILLIIQGVWQHSQENYQRMNHTIGTGNNRLLSLPPAISLNSWVHEHVAPWARQQLQADDTLLVIPEGLMFNFLYRVANPTRVHLFLPPDFFRLGENNIIQEIQREKPRYVLFWSRPTPDYGYPFLGSSDGYGVRLLAWLKQHYHPVYQVENGFSLDTPGEKGLLVLQARDVMNDR
ncbi:MAG: hypothetical protein H7833_12600 [Magnetococcus sp. DMHC-1]